MKIKAICIVIGIVIGWLTIPSVNAGEDNTYKGLLREAIGILRMIQHDTAATADNTKAIKDKLGAK